jgi:uncharacterized membrane-anchored protein
VALPAGDEIAHTIVALPDLSIKWERHGEFTTLTLVRPLGALHWSEIEDFPTAFDALPPGWLAQLPGRTIAAADIAVLPAGQAAPDLGRVARWFRADAMAGSRVLEEAAWLFSDFALREDGRTRWLALDVHLGRAQTARLVQRVIEIEVYRMTALLAFPLARAAFPQLNGIEQRLATITASIAALQGRQPSPEVQAQERSLLDDLTRVAAEVERSVAASTFRFSAAQAYWDIARARVAELREQRIGDMRTLAGFLARRVAPAMDSCAAAARRQEELSQRVSRTSNLLRTRVDVAREEQNQKLLAAMDRRGQLSLRMQQTVEGLSIAAITYYVVGLVGYFAKPLTQIWPRMDTDWVVAGAIPVVAWLVWRAVERVRRSVTES